MLPRFVSGVALFLSYVQAVHRLVVVHFGTWFVKRHVAIYIIQINPAQISQVQIITITITCFIIQTVSGRKTSRGMHLSAQHEPLTTSCTCCGVPSLNAALEIHALLTLR